MIAKSKNVIKTMHQKAQAYDEMCELGIKDLLKCEIIENIKTNPELAWKGYSWVKEKIIKIIEEI